MTKAAGRTIMYDLPGIVIGEARALLPSYAPGLFMVP